MRGRLAALVLVVVLAAGCASTGTGPPRQHSRQALTQEDLVGTNAGDTYEAVRMLRPGWLRKRGRMSLRDDGDVVVYLDNIRFGGPESLRTVPILSVGSMQYLDAPSATQRWGTDHVHGAILVTSR